jgi:hypothetical protein
VAALWGELGGGEESKWGVAVKSMANISVKIGTLIADLDTKNGTQNLLKA